MSPSSGMLPGFETGGSSGAAGWGGGGGIPGGGQNQYMNYPSLPNFNPVSQSGYTPGFGSPVSVPSFSGVSTGASSPGNYFKNSPGGVSDIGGNMFTAPTMDPAFTNQFFNMMSGQLMPQNTALTGNFMNMLMGGPSNIPGSFQMSQMAQTGQPITALPEWNAALAAMQRNIGENQANLKEQFNLEGNMASSPYGTAMSDYMTQTTLGQNAMLAQMQAQALENAMGREMQAGQGFQQLAGNQQQFLDQLFSQGALSSPQLFQKQHSSPLGGIGSLLGGLASMIPVVGPAISGLMGMFNKGGGGGGGGSPFGGGGGGGPIDLGGGV